MKATSVVDNLIQVPDGKVAGNAIGRLGNQMFASAAAMTYAKMTGRKFIGMIQTCGDNTYQEALNKTVMRNVKFTVPDDIEGFAFDPIGTWLCKGFPNTQIKNIYLNDYYQDSRCIDRDIAFDLFRPYDSVLDKINNIYGDVSDYVCVNVRRGDYLPLQKVGFNIYTKDEIEDIISTYFNNDKILFVSDDIKWCKENFHGNQFTFADKHGNSDWVDKMEIDLYIQTQCKSNVISNSSFSWWGAFLNEKAEKIVCHWPWFKPGMIDDMPTILPENWIKHTW